MNDRLREALRWLQAARDEAFSAGQSTRAIGFAELIVEAASHSVEG